MGISAIGWCWVGTCISAVGCDCSVCGCAGCSDIDCGRGFTSGDVPVDDDASVSGFGCARTERAGVSVCCVCSCDGVIVVGGGFGGCFSPCHSGNQTPWLHCSFPTPSSVSEQTSCDLVVTADSGKMVATCAAEMGSQGHRNAGSTSISSNCMVWKTFLMAANIVERILEQYSLRGVSSALPALM